MSSQRYLCDVFELKITLCHTKPPIWRRVLVPPTITLDRLHDVIQIVMGWKDMHLHLFEIDGQRYSEDPEDPEIEGTEESAFALCDLCTGKGSKLRYTYDFGDDWEHDVVIEGTRQIDQRWDPLIQCTAGKGACPAEDSGGPLAYDDEPGMNAQDHPDHTPDSIPFCIDTVNEELMKYMRWSRSRG